MRSSATWSEDGLGGGSGRRTRAALRTTGLLLDVSPLGLAFEAWVLGFGAVFLVVLRAGGAALAAGLTFLVSLAGTVRSLVFLLETAFFAAALAGRVFLAAAAGFLRVGA